MGVTSPQMVGAIQEMTKLVQSIQTATGGQDNGPNYDAIAEEQAKMAEIDGKSNAYDAQGKAKEEASATRKQREQARSNRAAAWGKSGILNTGSRQLVKTANAITDKQAEEDELFRGQQEADRLLDQGKRKANMLRINSGADRKQSTLSLGSTIYGPRS